VSEGDKPSWWQTLPGVLTAVAGVITAMTGLIVGLYQSHIFDASPRASLAANPSAIAERSNSPDTPQPVVQPAQPAAAPPSAAPSASSSQPAPAPTQTQNARRIDVLAPENGGHLVAASSDNWKITIDGDETYRCCFYPKQTAVYAFKDGKPASFELFSAFIDEARADNVHEFELSVGNDSPLGTFNVIARCEMQNLKLFETPYQECKFPAVRAKYFKVTIVSTFGSSSAYLQEFRLLGTLN
jgi:hypothetical protein